MDFEISAGQVKALLKQGEAITLLDVREPWELQKASLEGSKNIPMGEVPSRAHQELDPEELTRRIAAQVVENEARKNADDVIVNAGTIEDLRRTIERLYGVWGLRGPSA